jgi:hypothetical protein
MSRRAITLISALALFIVASASQAAPQRCKVKIGDDYRFLERTYTRGGCELEAKKYAGPRVCDSGDQYFDIKYSFDDTVYEATHLHCKLYMGSGRSSSSSSSSSSSASSSSHRERCKVKDGSDYHYLEAKYTKGGCEVEAKKHMGPKLCEGGIRKFHVTYLFDDTVYETDGYCANVR